MRGIIRERGSREPKRKECPKDQLQAAKATQIHAAGIKATGSKGGKRHRKLAKYIDLVEYRSCVFPKKVNMPCAR